MSSMKDVAQLAEVSISTVSRVINQSAQVDENTRRKVEEAILKLDYRPNLLARGLRQRGNRPGNVVATAYAVYEQYHEYAKRNKPYPGLPGKGRRLGFAGNNGTQPFCIALEHSLIKQARLAGFDDDDLILLDNQYDRATALRNADIMLSQEPDLFIQHQADIKVNSMIAVQFEKAGIPIIAVDIPVPGSPFVGCNDWQVAIMGGEHMAMLIRERWKTWEALDYVFLLQNPIGGEMTLLRSEGFVTALTDAFCEEARGKIIRADGGVGGAEQAKMAMNALLQTYPDAKKFAVTSLNEETMAGAIVALQNAGRWNPDDIIIITLGVDNLGKLQIRKGLSDAGVAFFPEKYGEYLIPAACAILHGAPVPSHMYVENHIITKANIDNFYPLI